MYRAVTTRPDARWSNTAAAAARRHAVSVPCAQLRHLRVDGDVVGPPDAGQERVEVRRRRCLDVPLDPAADTAAAADQKGEGGAHAARQRGWPVHAAPALAATFAGAGSAARLGDVGYEGGRGVRLAKQDPADSLWEKGYAVRMPPKSTLVGEIPWIAHIFHTIQKLGALLWD
jgi:hypothetical protein